MEKIVLDTNSLIQCISSRSPYRKIWDSFFDGTNLLCVTTSILNEYEEILNFLTNEDTAKYIIDAIVSSPYTRFVNVYFGTSASQHIDYELSEEIVRLNEQNTLNKNALIELIKQKVDEINKQNTEIILDKFYGEQEAKAKKNAGKKRAKPVVEKVIIDEKDGGKE